MNKELSSNQLQELISLGINISNNKSYTLEDIIDLLPSYINIDGHSSELIITKDEVKYQDIYTHKTIIYQPVVGPIVFAAFEILKYLIKNKQL